MQIHDLDPQRTGPPPSAKPTRRRRKVLLAAGALALVLSTVGTVAAVAGRSSPAVQAKTPSATQAAPNARDATNGQPAANAPPSTPASQLLADGTYPAYINKVDVKSATITVDVIQVFPNGEAAINAAVEDGMSRSEAQYLYVYIRNENPRLRTLGVARNVTIHFADGCDASPVRDKALTELAKRTATFNTMYYYDVVIANGRIQQITQRLAQAAC